MSENKPHFGNAEVIFSENKNKLKYFPPRLKKKKLFPKEYMYITIHSLTESTTYLKAHFKSFYEFSFLNQEKNKVPKISTNRGTSKIALRNKEFIEAMANDKKKRVEFMDSVQRIKDSKMVKSRSEKDIKIYNFINQSKPILIHHQCVIAFEERREKVLENKEKEWKLKIFNTYKRQIRSELKHKLNGIKKGLRRMNTKTWFWIKLLYATKYITLCRDNYETTREQWLTSIMQNFAAKRITTHWRRFIERKGEIVSIRTAMFLRQA